MFCSISNEPCLHPVISKKTGHIFEKALLEKHIKIHNTCPITSEPMTNDDMIEIQNNKLPSAPKQINNTSIPSLLKTFQNEWDELMLESYNLKRKLQDTRQQLSHSMYQYDAAIRVIARLTQERDRALQELANTRESMASALSQIEAMKALHLQKQAVSAKNTTEDEDVDMNVNGKSNDKQKESGMDVDNEQDLESETKDNNENKNVLSEQLVKEIASCSMELAKIRKKQSKIPSAGLVSMEVIHNEYKVNDDLSYIGHSESDPGINCMDISAQYPHQRIITGGNDCQIIIYNRNTKKFEYVLKGHNKPINDIKFHSNQQDVVLSASADNSCIIWKLLQNEKSQKVWNINDIYNDQVLSLSIHPLNDYFLSCSRDGMWYFHSLRKQQTFIKQRDTEIDNMTFNCMELHPDGQILAIGCNNKKLKIWDIRTNTVGFTFNLEDTENGENISCINFNENGYYLGAGDKNGVVNIWDLRKMGKSKNKQFLKQIHVEHRVKCVQFDKSGQYLGIGQPNGIQLYLSKKWSKFASFECHRKDVTAIKFANDAKFIVTASRDRNVKILTNQQTI